MLSPDTLTAAVARMASAASSPCLVLLFGSRARGTADPGSDVDLLVAEREVHDRAGEYMRLRDALGRLGPGIGVDLLLCDENEFASRRQVVGSVWHRASAEGVVLHDGL